ncbi:MAG: nitroreductase family protein [Acidaminobacteraceae bacterium]
MNHIDLMQKRISTRKFKDEKIKDVHKTIILDYANRITPLTDDIKWSIQITDKKDVIKGMISAVGKMYYKVFAPSYILLTSEDNPRSNENIGYVGEKLILKLTELGIGSCWIGAPIKRNAFANNFEVHGKEKYVIMIAIGYPLTDFDFVSKRIRMTHDEIFVGSIKDEHKKAIEALRIAPSAVNSQPWIVYGDNDTWDVYIKYKSGLFGSMLKRMNKIDIGIGFSHMLLAFDEMGIFYSINYKNNPLNIKSQDYFATIKFI